MFLIKIQYENGYSMYAAKSYTTQFKDNHVLIQFDHASDNEPHAAATITITIAGSDMVWITNAEGRTVDRIAAPNSENSRLGYTK